MNTKLRTVWDIQGRRIDLFDTAGQISDYIGARASHSTQPSFIGYESWA